VNLVLLFDVVEFAFRDLRAIGLEGFLFLPAIDLEEGVVNTALLTLPEVLAYVRQGLLHVRINFANDPNLRVTTSEQPLFGFGQ
jgi:hypothetical protein